MRPRIFTHIAATTLFAALLAVSPVAAQDGSTLFSAPRQYTVQVLPGLGGLGGAFSINNLGWASGVSEPPGDPYDRAFLWRNGQATDLGTLGGYNSSVAFPNKNEIGWLAGGRKQWAPTPFRRTFADLVARRKPASPLIRSARGSSGEARRTK